VPASQHGTISLSKGSLLPGSLFFCRTITNQHICIKTTVIIAFLIKTQAPKLKKENAMTSNQSVEFADTLKLIIRHAQGDTSGSNRCAAFLLALWDGGKYPIDLQDMMYLDDTIYTSMLYILRMLYDYNAQLDTFINQETLETIFVLENDKWRKR